MARFAPLPDHLQALHDALRAEEAHERDTLARLIGATLDERVALGVSFPRLVVDRCWRDGRGQRARLRAPKGVVLHDRIGSGDPIRVVAGSRARHGWCVGHDGHAVEVRIDGDLPEGAKVEVQQRADPSTWVRYRQALERAAATPSPLVRHLLDGTEPPAELAPPVVPEQALSGLDPAQHRAAVHALTAPVLAVIHGPPGTGKTHVLASVLAALVSRGERPWALADSNAAVDHLALAAAARGLRVVRLGHPARIGDAASELSMDAHLRRSPLAPAIDALERDIAKVSGREARGLIDEVRALRDQARAHVLDKAQVVASTFGTLSRRASSLPPPTTAVVDEATQASEPATWVAVPWVERLVLAGDPHQLGPVSKVPGSPLGRSLLERVLEEGIATAPMLEVQHRMDARLRQLVAPIYGPRYTDHPAAAEQPVEELLSGPSPFDVPAVWLDTAGAGLEESIDPLTHSRRNRGEGRLVVAVVEALRRAGLRDGDLALLTPYNAQVGVLEALLPGVTVATVNAFQGREVPVMVVSWVRSNPDGEIGFVADPRRLTVTLTRARRLLVQVGDSALLAGHPRFAEVIDGIAAAGGLRSVFEPPWDDVLLDA